MSVYSLPIRIDLKIVVKAVIPAGRKPESTLRQAQGDSCHGELVEPWIPAQLTAGMTHKQSRRYTTKH